LPGRGFFEFRCRTGELAPRLIDVDATRAACAIAAAFGNDARNTIADRALHHGPTDLDFDRMLDAAGLDVRDLRHINA
jgi:hypothetical protein